MDDEGLQRSAILLMSLGEEEASEVFKYLSPKEVQRLGETMSLLKNITRDQIENVLEDFCTEADEKTPLGQDSDEYIRKVLGKALGEEKAAALLDRILHGGDNSGIESLKWMDSPAVAELIKDEHPQIVATILVHLERDQASEILSHFTERLRNDTLLRIATLDSIQPVALRELNDVLTKLMSGGASNIKKSSLGGVRTTAEILNFIPSSQEEEVIENIRSYDADLAQKIMDEMFVFENILELDDQAIQLLLREVQSESLIIALKGAPETLREKVFKNMSQRAAEMLREDLESKGPVRVSEVEAEQRAILGIVRRLSDEGQIIIGGKGDDGFI